MPPGVRFELDADILSRNIDLTPEKYWKDHGREIYQDMKPRMKIDNEVKRAAAKVIEDAATPEDKLQRIVPLLPELYQERE